MGARLHRMIETGKHAARNGLISAKRDFQLDDLRHHLQPEGNLGSILREPLPPSLLPCITMMQSAGVRKSPHIDRCFLSKAERSCRKKRFTGSPMRFVLLASFGSLLLSGCAMQRAQEAEAAKASMVGMAKEDVLACMGPPTQKLAEGATEVWSYPSGNGATATFSTASAAGQGSAYGSPGGATWNSSASGFGTSFTHHRFCEVNVVMRNNAVMAVHYSGPTGGLLTKGSSARSRWKTASNKIERGRTMSGQASSIIADSIAKRVFYEHLSNAVTPPISRLLIDNAIEFLSVQTRVKNSECRE